MCSSVLLSASFLLSTFASVATPIIIKIVQNSNNTALSFLNIVFSPSKTKPQKFNKRAIMPNKKEEK